MCTTNSEVCDNLTTMGTNADSDIQSSGELSARHEQRCVERYCPMATTIRDQPSFIKMSHADTSLYEVEIISSTICPHEAQAYSTTGLAWTHWNAVINDMRGHSSMWVMCQEFREEKQVIAQSCMENSHRQVKKQAHLDFRSQHSLQV